LRTSPIFPVRQKPHDIAQPTCVEMQNVIAGVSGMKTDSIRRPSASSSTNLRVPSIEVSSLTVRDVVSANSSGSCARRVRDRSVIDPKSVTPRL
jgi:hypothetical protein